MKQDQPFRPAPGNSTELSGPAVAARLKLHPDLRWPAMSGSFVIVHGVLAFLMFLGIATPQTSGQQFFEKRCGGCHALDRDKEGPRLAGVYGRAAGSVTSFQYSPALQKSKLTWTSETLDKWLTDPDKLVPNNDMTFSVHLPDCRRWKKWSEVISSPPSSRQEECLTD
jgi:cytochrome c2